MKTFNAVLLLALIYAVNSDLSGFDTQTCIGHTPSALSSFVSGGGNVPAYSLDFCRSTNYEGYERCCFLKYEDTDKRRQYYCLPLSTNQFWNIDGTIETLEGILKVDVDSLDCSSSYLYASLLLIFALLF